MKKLISATLLISLLLLNSSSADATEYAWWVNIEYEPGKTEILNIPLSDLDANWAFAEPLSIAAVPPEDLQVFKRDTAASGYSFTKQGDFNLDGRQDKAIVGIYKEKNGAGGRFLLVLAEAENNKWIKSSLLKSPGKAGFSILSIDNGTLAWYFCMECDALSFVKWEKDKYVLVPFDCC